MCAQTLNVKCAFLIMLQTIPYRIFFGPNFTQIKEKEVVLENRERNETNTIHKLKCTQWHGSWLVSEVMFSAMVSKSVQNYMYIFLKVF